MSYRRHTGAALLALAGLLLPSASWARQNIAIGEISIGYDYQERNYDETELAPPLAGEAEGSAADVANGASADSAGAGDAPTATTNANGSTDPAAILARTPTLRNEREGDTRSLFVTPRLRVSSRGARDLVEFTYGPTFTWDDVDSSNNVGHDLNLLAEKSLSQRWQVQATDSFYYGTDTLADYERRSGAILPVTEVVLPEAGVSPQEPVGQELTEDYGRREYWRNDFGLQTDYTYAPDSVVGAGYNFGLLRNVGDDIGGYDDYDRHEGIGRMSYRFNSRWRTETQLSYVKGIYEEATFPVRQQATAEADGAAPTTEIGNGTTGEETLETVETEDLSDDLEEYHGRLRLNHDWSAQDMFFGEYSYSATKYESPLNEDAAIHRLTAGWEHAFTSHLRLTLSAGPTFISYDESDNETGYNGFAGLEWQFLRSSLTASTAYDYEFENFDGRSSGLSKVWYSQLGYSYQFTPTLQTSLTAGYKRNDREEPRDIRRLAAIESVASDGSDTGLTRDNDHFQYTDDTWDAGVRVSYTFLRWYTAAVSYRYSDFQSDYELDYDEHRVLCTLTATSDIFRW